MPAAPIKVQDLADEINRMREREAGMTVQLSRAEANLQRKMEMIEILKGQLDEADKKSSMAMTVAERMKMQEQLLQAQTHADQLKKEIETERAQNSANIQELEAKLEEECLNSKEMLAELRQIRAEKDSEAAVAASTIKALTDERNMLRMEMAALQSEGNMLRNELSTVQFQQQELQQMRKDYANLDEVVQSSKIDNLALSAQIKFLSTQLQEAKNAEIAGEALKQTMVPAVPLSDHNDEQARFYEQEVRSFNPQPSFPPSFVSLLCVVFSLDQNGKTYQSITLTAIWIPHLESRF
jgi:chromosome segregation ATPase